MENPLRILPSAPGDAPAIVKLVNSAYRGDSSRKGWTTEADLLDGIRTDEKDISNLLLQPGNTILKCIDEHDAILGCVYLQKKQAAMYLGMLTVLPHLQAQGIGKLLLGEAENFAALHGCKHIEMTVISVRHELIAWYNKKGYYPTGATKPFPVDNKFGIAKMPLEFIVLQKNI